MNHRTPFIGGIYGLAPVIIYHLKTKYDSGISSYYHDSAAVGWENGIIAAAQEERVTA